MGVECHRIGGRRVTTAKVRLKSSDISMDSIAVFHGVGRVDVQLGPLLVEVGSEQHWDDVAAKVKQCFANLGEPRQVPPRKDNVKPTDYSSVNCSGACYCGEDE